jgi:hypothetical protein
MSTGDYTAPAVRYLPVEGDPGYRVGDDGSFWSRIRHRRGDQVWYGDWKRLEPTPQYWGHIAVRVGRIGYRFVHRLVLEAFVGPCPEGMECRHLDGDPANNRLENLRWGTHRENAADQVRHGTAAWLRPECHERAHRLWDYVKHKSGPMHHRSKSRISDNR